jgi:hypothetical protein
MVRFVSLYFLWFAVFRSFLSVDVFFIGLAAWRIIIIIVSHLLRKYQCYVTYLNNTATSSKQSYRCTVTQCWCFHLRAVDLIFQYWYCWFSRYRRVNLENCHHTHWIQYQHLWQWHTDDNNQDDLIDLSEFYEQVRTDIACSVTSQWHVSRCAVLDARLLSKDTVLSLGLCVVLCDLTKNLVDHLTMWMTMKSGSLHLPCLIAIYNTL